MSITTLSESFASAPLVPPNVSLFPITETNDIKVNGEESEEDNQPLQIDPGPFCICRGPDDGTPMICCDLCNEWYHCRCVRLGVKTAKALQEFFCFKCRPNEPYNLPMTNPKKSPYGTRSASAGRRSHLPSELISELAYSDDDSEDDGRYTRSQKPYGPGSNRANRTGNGIVDKRKIPDSKVNAQAGQQKKLRLTNDDERRMKIRELLSGALQQEKDFPIEKVKSYAAEIEIELFKNFDLATYKNKIRTIQFNLKDPKNGELRRSILSNELPVNVLCKMSAADLANKDLAEYRKQRDEKLLSELVIKEDSPILMRRMLVDKWTAGDLALANDTSAIPTMATLTPPIDNTDEITVIEEGPAVSPPPPLEDNNSRNSIIDDTFISIKDINIPDLPSVDTIDIPSFDEFDEKHNDETSTTTSSSSSSTSKSTMKHRDRSKSKSKMKNMESSNNVNNNEEGEENIEESENNTVVWEGHIKTTSTHKFKVNAIKISGEGKLATKTIPETLLQVGRMDINQLNKYLPELQYSTSRKLEVVLFEPATPQTEEESALYASAFDNLMTSNRAAVLKIPQFKEAYIVPISRTSIIPEWLDGYRSNGQDRLFGALVSARTTPISSSKLKNLKQKTKEKRRNEETTVTPPTTPPMAATQPFIPTTGPSMMPNPMINVPMQQNVFPPYNMPPNAGIPPNPMLNNPMMNYGMYNNFPVPSYPNPMMNPNPAANLSSLIQTLSAPNNPTPYNPNVVQNQYMPKPQQQHVDLQQQAIKPPDNPSQLPNLDFDVLRQLTSLLQQQAPPQASYQPNR